MLDTETEQGTVSGSAATNLEANKVAQGKLHVSQW
jgi:hypothetical protein